MKKICKRCKRLKEHEAMGLCKSCYMKYIYAPKHKKVIVGYRKKYYQEHKEGIIKRNNKRTRDKKLKKRFGFVPKLFIYNKDVTSDGCFYGNSRIVDRFHNYIGKMMLLYKCGKLPDEYYKIQIIECNTGAEFWFRSHESREWTNRFFNRLKNYPVNFLRYWEIERVQV